MGASFDAAFGLRGASSEDNAVLELPIDTTCLPEDILKSSVLSYFVPIPRGLEAVAVR
jgi:hypothetical protein